MSRSRSALRALSSPRLPKGIQPPNRTLLPFLYQTATIQQCRHRRWPIARQYHAPGRRTTLDEDLPFEKASSIETEHLPPTLDQSADEAGLVPSRKSTVTAAERVAFQKLYEKLGQDTRQGGDEHVPFAGTEDGDMIFDEYYEEEDGLEDKVDEGMGKAEGVFAKVISQTPLPRAELESGKARRRSEILKTLASKEGHGRKSREELKEEKETLRTLRDGERIRIMGLMDEAQTDVDIWSVLQREVFDVIRALDLDKPASALDKASDPDKTGKKSGKKGKVTAKAPTSTSEQTSSETTDDSTHPTAQKSPTADPRVLFPNYPQLLVHAAALLQNSFPVSQVSLSILPTIKSLGRSSFALGATTPLYNLLLSKTWSTYSTPNLITDLLSDMDNAGLTPDSETLQIIESILSDIKQGRSGAYGKLISKVWSMEMGTQDALRLRGWRDALRQRLGVCERDAAGGVGWGRAHRKDGRGLIRRVVQPGGFERRPQKEAVVFE